MFLPIDKMLFHFTDDSQARFRRTKINSSFLVSTGCFEGDAKSRGYVQSTLRVKSADYDRMWRHILSHWQASSNDPSLVCDFICSLGVPSPNATVLSTAAAEIRSFLERNPIGPN